MESDTVYIRSKITAVPDFPKKGIIFRDITSLISDPLGIKKVIEIFYERYKDGRVEVVAGIESRGFIIGSLIANKLNVPFVLIRKKGKLPREVVREEYDLEYGKDCIEMHRESIKKGQRVLIVDDLLATGGTCLAACNLVKRLGGEIVECGFIIDLPDLHGKEKLEKSGFRVFNIIEFEGD